MKTCTAEFARLSAGMPGLRCDNNPFVSFTSPFSLSHWTMPVIEFLLVASAVAALVHALRWRRKTGDRSNLVIWICSILSLLLIEPFAYFPQWWGLEDSLGLIFVHNKFSVQFLYDRLPLYIIAMYPAYTYLAWVLVQRTGVLKRYHPIIGAACVAFVFHCFYEIVDTVGVQFRWWAWNQNLPMSHPSLGVVPYPNLQAFSIAIPFGLALVTLLVSRLRENRWAVSRDVAIVSLAVWPLQWITLIPSLLIHLVGVPTGTARMIATWLLIVAAGAATAWTFLAAYRTRVDDPSSVSASVRHDYFALVSAVLYLVACVVFWGAALPDYLAASGGVTPTGAPTGSLTYGVITFALSIALLVGAYAKTTGAPPETADTGTDPRQTASV